MQKILPMSEMNEHSLSPKIPNPSQRKEERKKKQDNLNENEIKLHKYLTIFPVQKTIFDPIEMVYRKKLPRILRKQSMGLFLLNDKTQFPTRGYHRN